MMSVKGLGARGWGFGVGLLVMMFAASAYISTRPANGNLAGDWDVYIALSATPKFGFEGWRRMAFAHFAGTDSSNVGYIWRRTGQPILTANQVSVNGDSVILTQDPRVMMRAAWHGDTLVGVQSVNGRVLDRRFRFVRRSTPGVVEHDYQVWNIPASDSQYAITEDTLVLMPTRDGAHLATYVAMPVGNGPFGVVMQRSPYRRINHAAGVWWGSRGYIYIGQHVRGREESSGDVADFGDYSTDINDGYDAVEWAARLPHSNGKVGMIGHSDEGRLVWYAAVSNPPHLAAISPTAASPDPWVVVPYAAMAFGPINVDWACLMRDRIMQPSTADLDIGEAIRHLPLITLPQRLGCGDIPLWDRWIAHPTLDAYWHKLAATTYIGNVRAPVLSMAGWHDDSRGPTYFTDSLLNHPQHPNWHIVMNPGAHKGVDYVTGDFGPNARYAYRDLQLRWFDHYLMGKNNGVDTLPHVDDFVMGDNVWRTENEWPLARQHLTNFYISSGGHAQTSSGDGVLDSLPPTGAAVDTFTYDPADPTPYLIDSRELEESLNEDYTQLNATRKDALVFTSAPLTRPLEVTGEMTAKVWAATDRTDTDWTIMLLDVFPDGHSERVQDGLVRARFRQSMSRIVPVVPGRVYPYDIDVWFTSMVFPAGHRLRVSIASALFPKYDRNLNTNGNYERDTTFVVAHQRVLHDAAHPTHITLPVIPR